MRNILVCACALAVATPAMVLAESSPSRIVVDEERIVSGPRISEDIDVRDVRVRGGTVMGTIVNNSDKALRDVRLQIRHLWLWNNEFHPGSDDPGRTEFHTLPGEIPPNGRAEFTYRMDSPLPERSDGRFNTQVEVVSMLAVESRPTAAF
jgi:hypothetical protein